MHSMLSVGAEQRPMLADLVLKNQWVTTYIKERFSTHQSQNVAKTGAGTSDGSTLVDNHMSSPDGSTWQTCKMSDDNLEESCSKRHGKHNESDASNCTV